MKKQVFYIHGGESYDDYEVFLEQLRTKEIWDLPSEQKKGKWTKTLAEDLGEEYEVFTPRMPNSNNAKYEEWKIWFERHFEHLRDGVVLAGCSLGAMFLAKYLSQNDLLFTPKEVILMAGAYDVKGVEFDKTDCGDFLVAPESLKTLTDKFGKVVIMHSKDDFLVPFECGVALSEALPEAEFVTFTDKNHFLIEEFPELVAHIKGL